MVAEIYGDIRAPPIDHWIHHSEKCDNKVLLCCFSLLYNRTREVWALNCCLLIDDGYVLSHVALLKGDVGHLYQADHMSI